MANKSAQVAKRYAKALFGMCEPQAFDATQLQLQVISACFETSQDFRRVISSPSITMEQQLSVVEGLVKSTNIEYSDLMRKFFSVLLQTKRFVVITQISELFTQLVSSYRKNLGVEVTTSKAISEEERNSFINRLKETLGSGVTVAWKEDKSIGGGAIIKSGDRLIDRSVVGVLEQMRNELLAA